MSEIIYHTWINGELSKCVHPMSHSMQYSTSVFEGIRSFGSEKNIYKLRDHLTRLFNSAKAIGMSLEGKYTIDSVEKEIIDKLKKTDIKNAYIRPMFYLNENNAMLRSSYESKEVNFLIAIRELGMPNNSYENGLRVYISSIKKPNSANLPVNIKASFLYAIYNMALNEAIRNGADESLMLESENNYISELSVRNIFFIDRNLKIVTPSRKYCLPGITRQSVLDICKNCEELSDVEDNKNINIDDLHGYIGCFATGTANGISYINSIFNSKMDISFNDSKEVRQVIDNITRKYYEKVTEGHKYRKGVGMIILKGNKVLVGHRISGKSVDPRIAKDFSGTLQMPQGGVEEFESYEEALQREMLEEVGIRLGVDAKIIHEIPFLIKYKFPNDVIPNSFRVKGYIGQEHKWFILRVDDNFNPDLSLALDQEFSEIFFTDFLSLIQMAWEFKKPVYTKIFTYLKEQGFII